MVTCPRCGVASPEGFRFCPSCASPLTAPEVGREERKVVSVLFADLVGFTANAERMDPEDVRALLGPFHARLRAEIERFGGTVEKFIGDAVMALFGAPVAHEDDPERAVRAALAIRDWVTQETDLHVRIAVTTGEALVALRARPAEGEGMASGDVVNTAARLQAAAPVDGIIVGEATWRATERAIDYREHESVLAKGKAEPLRVWEAVQARSRFGVDVARRSAAPLVGRERELDLLRGALQRAIDEHVPQLVTLVGVPGIGKSRLLAELFASIEAGDRLVTWRQGRSLPYGEGVSFWALGEIVKAQAGILDTDAPNAAARKLDDAVRSLIADDADATWVSGHLRPLAGLVAEDATGDRREEAFAAWRRFLEALAELRPAVLVFEDLHWADDGLLDFVDHVVDWLVDVPVLIVATARPELLARRPAWGGGKANASTISLAPLSDDETARLVHALLERSVLAAEVQAMLLERAGGNPLYAEEFARMAGERGRRDLELPSSVQGIIAARLDALDEADKILLQDASVLGKVFWSGALAAIGDRDRNDVERRLHALERRELARRERRSSVAGENEYAFRHVLVRDVAYASIPRAARADRHRRAAEWIESLGRPDDHGDLLAHHYLSAIELARAAGTDPGTFTAAASLALRRAGDRALALHAVGNAARFYQEALAIGVDESSRPLVLFRLASALHYASDPRRTGALEAARDALVAAGDPETAAEAVLLLAEAAWFDGDSARARDHLAHARELVRDRPDSPAAVRVLAQSARSAMLAAQSEEGLRLGRAALRMAEELGLDDLVPHALIAIGGCRQNLGDDGGTSDLERAIELAMAANNPVAARAYNNLAAAVSEQGDLERAEGLWREGKRVADRLGNGIVRRFIDGQLFWIDFERGRWDQALEAAEAFIAECEAGSPHYLHSSALFVRAYIRFARGETEVALAAADEALERARHAGDPQQVLPALAAIVGIRTDLGQLDEARHVAAEMIELSRVGSPVRLIQLALDAEELGLTSEMRDLLASRPPTRFSDISQSILDGDLVAAAEQLEEVTSLPYAASARIAAARRFVASGRRADADEQLRRALDFYRTVRASRYIADAEALLRATA